MEKNLYRGLGRGKERLETAADQNFREHEGEGLGESSEKEELGGRSQKPKKVLKEKGKVQSRVER